MRARDNPPGWLGRGEGQVGGEVLSAAGAGGAWRRGRSRQKEEPAGREAKEEEGVEDRKEGTMEEMRALNPGQAARGRLARSGKTKPEEAGDRQRFCRQNICSHLSYTLVSH